MSLDKPCQQRDPATFDSTDWRDHVIARAVCSTCNSVPWCIRRAIDIAGEHSPGARAYRGPDGTWGGLLWVDGSICPTAADVAQAKGSKRSARAAA